MGALPSMVYIVTSCVVVKRSASSGLDP